MARRRGIGNNERFALDMATVTATGAVVSTPCFVYTLDASLSNVAGSSATGVFSIGDTTAAGDLLTDGKYFKFVVGGGAAASPSDRIQRNFFPPLFIEKGLYFAAATGMANVSVSYSAVS